MRFLRRELRAVLAALAFLSVLLPRACPSEDDIGRAAAYLPLAGLILGLLAGLPAFIPTPYAGAKAFLILLASLYLTRCLHLDGWADVWDGWGSFRQGEAFWVVLKDSRIGAFGGVALILAVGGWLILLPPCLTGPDSPAWAIVPWAFVLGRSACLALCLAARPLVRGSGLGRMFILGATPARTLAGLAVTPLVAVGCIRAGLLTPGLILVSTGLAGAVVLSLLRFARRQGGLNGDFLGAGIVAGELAALLAWNLLP